jgi:hypothetical protein
MRRKFLFFSAFLIAGLLLFAAGVVVYSIAAGLLQGIHASSGPAATVTNTPPAH